MSDLASCILCMTLDIKATQAVTLRLTRSMISAYLASRLYKRHNVALKRISLGPHIAAMIGDPPLRLTDGGTGWPMLAQLATGDKNAPLALHVSNVGPHARRDYEYRFQNPGDRSPVSDNNGYPILLGLAPSIGGGEVLIGLDGSDRVGREARFSILFHKRIIEEARTHGIAYYESSKGERIYAFRPELFSTFVEVLGADIPFADVQAVVAASDPPIGPDPVASERTRRAANILVRHHSFGRRVKAAHGGKCCLCGLGVNLVTSAHIYPASAPDSPDNVSNGLALCPNHHTAFDSHDLWLNPATLSPTFSPRYLAAAAASPAMQAFIASTFAKLTMPVDLQHRPSVEMLNKRYEYYSDKYDWT